MKRSCSSIIKAISLVMIILFALNVFPCADHLGCAGWAEEMRMNRESIESADSYLYGKQLEPKYVYKIQPGDLLEIRVLQGPELDGQRLTVRVSAKGTFKFPYLDEIFVAGLQEDELAEKMEGALSKFFAAPQIYVLVKQYATQVKVEGYYDVYGEVGRQGKYNLEEGLTVVNAILRAGGFTPYASTNGVKVLRRDAETGMVDEIKVPVGRIFKTGDKSQDIEVREDDVILVPESWF